MRNWRLSLIGVIICGLWYKVLMVNDVSLSVAEDPMEIWIALGISMILSEQFALLWGKGKDERLSDMQTD